MYVYMYMYEHMYICMYTFMCVIALGLGSFSFWQARAARGRDGAPEQGEPPAAGGSGEAGCWAF